MTIIWPGDPCATERAVKEAEDYIRFHPKAGVDYKIEVECPKCGAQYPDSLRAMVDGEVNCKACGAKFIEHFSCHGNDMLATYELV